MRWVHPVRRTHRLLSGAAAVFLACVTLSTPAVAADSDRSADLGAIDRYVRSEMAAQHIPGLALGIVHGDRVVHLQGFGKADEAGRTVTPTTPFFIGSVTKSFTALAIMQLKEAGLVDLNAPVRRYLPWWRVADAKSSATVSVRDLLYQVSGLSRATGNARASSGPAGAGALQTRVRHLRSAELTAPVGSTWQYSNANYWTLGMVVQAASGLSYEDYVQQRIFDPLGMRNAFTSAAQADKGGVVSGYRYWYGHPFAAKVPFDLGGVPAGGLAASAADMARYLRVYPNAGLYPTGRLLSRAGMTELQDAGVPTGLKGIAYAMGWEVASRNGVTTVSHDGSDFNSHANVILLPDLDWGVVVMENAENSPDEFFGSRRMTGIANGVADLLTGHEATPTSTSSSVRVVYLIVIGIVGLQAICLVRSLRAFRRWRTTPELAPSGMVRTGWRLGVPLLANVGWALAVLLLVPRAVRAPWSAVVMGLPDLAYPLLASCVLSLLWGPLRTVLAIRALHAGRPALVSSGGSDRLSFAGTRSAAPQPSSTA